MLYNYKVGEIGTKDTANGSVGIEEKGYPLIANN